jgi:hypothetical protein
MSQAMTKLPYRWRASRRLGAAFGLALFLALQLFASSDALHRWIHADANSADHHCAVTLFSHGQVNAAESLAPLAAFVAAMFFLLPPLQSAVFSSVEYRFSPSRAPPRL